jgi:hypothetical protein
LIFSTILKMILHTAFKSRKIHEWLKKWING